MKAYLAIAAVLTLGACSMATTTGSTVQIASERSAVAGCAPLGQIQSSSYWGGVAATGLAYNEAMNDLKNKTAERGGTHVVLVNSSNTVGGTNMIGDVYRCGT